MKNYKFIYFYYLLLLGLFLHLANFGFSQSLLGNNNKSILRKGNKDYKEKNFERAAKYYNQVLENDPKNIIGHFNLGNTYYRKSAFDTAMTHYQAAIHELNDEKLKSKGYYNLGNVMLQKREFQKAIDAYKQSLKADPNNEDARYNLSYALKMLQQQQQQQQQQRQDQKNQDKQKNEQQQDKKEEPNDDKNQQKKQQQEQKNEMSREEAERILNALKNREKELKNHQKKEKVKGNGTTEKDW